MKFKFIFLFITIFYSALFFSQALKFRAVSAGFAPISEEYHPNFKKDNSIIVLSIDEKKLTIYNNELEYNYHIYKVYDEEKNEDGYSIFEIDTIDDDGVKFKLYIFEYLKNQYEKKQKSYYNSQLVIKNDDSYMMINMNKF